MVSCAKQPLEELFYFLLLAVRTKWWFSQPVELHVGNTSSCEVSAVQTLSADSHGLSWWCWKCMNMILCKVGFWKDGCETPTVVEFIKPMNTKPGCVVAWASGRFDVCRVWAINRGWFFFFSLSFSCNMASGHHYTPPPPLLCDLEESGRERPEVNWMHWVADWQRAEGFAINVVRRTRVNIHVCSWAALSSFIQALQDCPWFKRLPSSDVTACKLCYFLCFIHGWHQI